MMMIRMAEAGMNEPLVSSATLEKVAAGDEHAFALLVQQYSTPVFRFLYRMINQAEDAEDLTQDTFHELYKHHHNIRTECDIAPYIFTIAKRKAISHLRWKMVRRIVSPMLQEHEQIIEDPTQSVRDHHHHNQMEHEVQNAINALKPEKRAAVILRFFERMPYKEIAKVMNKKEGTVKSIVCRAEKDLRQILAPLEADWRSS
jgi:RNA polymerase sigma-70 factor (ECF subfamily)